VGRNTQGVRLIRTIEGEHVVGLQRIDEIEEDEINVDESLDSAELVDARDADIVDADDPE